MRTPDSHPNRRRLTLSLRVAIAFAAILTVSQALAQEQPRSGAVEKMAPVFDVGIEMRPRAGLFGITELMMAALEADIFAAQHLLDAGADVNETDDSQSTPLMWAVHSDDVRIVQFLLDNGANVNARAFQGATALINAISGEQESIAIVLLNAGADPNGRGNSVRNFLESAAESGMTSVVDALIENGAELSTHGRTALEYAVASRNIGPVESLLIAGVDVNALLKPSMRSVLYTAVKTRDLDMVRLLIAYGADAGQGAEHQSPLYPAASAGSNAIAELLLDSGAVATPSVVLVAVRNKKIDTATILLHYVDIDSFERSQIENLLVAADHHGDDDFMRMLLNAAGAPPVNDQDVVLLYSPGNSSRCELMVWDPDTGARTTIYQEDGECDGKFFVADGSGFAFVLTNDEIRSISISGTGPSFRVKYPLTQIDEQVRKLGAKFEERLGSGYGNMGASAATVVDIGYLEGGHLGLATLTYGPADGQHMHLFGHIGDEWQLVAEQACGRMESGCAFAQLNGRRVLDWPRQRRAWSPSIRENPYFRSKGTAVTEFEINGQRTLLRYSTNTYGHCGGDCTYAASLELVLPDNPGLVLSDGQSRHSIFQQFLLLLSNTRSADGRQSVDIELIDMATGEKMFEALERATWLEQ